MPQPQSVGRDCDTVVNDICVYAACSTTAIARFLSSGATRGDGGRPRRGTSTLHHPGDGRRNSKRSGSGSLRRGERRAITAAASRRPPRLLSPKIPDAHGSPTPSPRRLLPALLLARGEPTNTHHQVVTKPQNKTCVVCWQQASRPLVLCETMFGPVSGLADIERNEGGGFPQARSSSMT